MTRLSPSEKVQVWIILAALVGIAVLLVLTWIHEQHPQTAASFATPPLPPPAESNPPLWLRRGGSFTR